MAKNKVSINQISQKTLNNKENIYIEGWIKTNRSSKKIGFLTFNDGSCFSDLQIVYKATQINNFNQVADLLSHSAIQISGVLIYTPGAKQEYEVDAKKINIVDQATSSYPLQQKNHTREYLRNIAHLRSSTRLFNAIMRIRSRAAFSIHEYFIKKNYIYVNTPIITSNDAEGAGEVFYINQSLDPNKESFFGKKATLTVSGQLHAESYAQTFKNVYTFGPTFRAENSNTLKHASEFWMLEPEVAFCDLNQLMDLIEDNIKFIIKQVMINNTQELEYLNNNVNSDLVSRLKHVANSDFKKITYKQAIEVINTAIKNKKYKFKETELLKFGDDLKTEQERYIAEVYVNGPCFVYNYPKMIKSFYMKQNDDNETVAACDLLVPGIGELAGGSQRENDYKKITQRYQEVNCNISDLQWYLDLRKYGYYMSAGFGLGFSRLIMYLTAVENIKDVIPFPRTSSSLKF